MEGLVEALQSLGLTEGVRLLRQAELREDKQNTGTELILHCRTNKYSHKHYLSTIYILYVVPFQKQMIVFYLTVYAL